FKAAEKGNYEIVEILINNGADINAKTRFNTSAIHFAAFYNKVEIIKLLVEKGADFNLRNSQGIVPIFYAAMRGAIESVKCLIEHGADYKVKDDNKQNLLHAASANGNTELMKYLINKNLDLHSADIYNKTPLFYAAEKGLTEITDMYIENGDIDYQTITTDGSTYLHAAAKGGLLKFVDKIIEDGVDINSANVYNYTPIDIAEMAGHQEIVDLLILKGAESTENKFKTQAGEFLGQPKPGSIPELFAPGIISTPELNERDVTFSLDGTELYFTRWPVERVWNIMVVKQTESGWTDAEPASFMKPYHHAEACFTPDDKKMFFISNRPADGEGEAENWEIWFTERTSSEWNEPNLLGEEFKGGFYPTFTNDWRLYYTDANADISCADLVDGKYTNINRFGDAVNTDGAEYNSCIAPDESYLIFTSDGQPDQLGKGDLYICFRNDDGTWTNAKNMGPKINSWALDYCPAVSRDGKYFFFSSRKYGNEDIFWVETKIFDNLRN
ncbi:ankyrin repeat domain-containing protein, partial [Bacteroidota bacterium]